MSRNDGEAHSNPWKVKRRKRIVSGARDGRWELLVSVGHGIPRAPGMRSRQTRGNDRGCWATKSEEEAALYR